MVRVLKAKPQLLPSAIISCLIPSLFHKQWISSEFCNELGSVEDKKGSRISESQPLIYTEVLNSFHLRHFIDIENILIHFSLFESLLRIKYSVMSKQEKWTVSALDGNRENHQKLMSLYTK